MELKGQLVLANIKSKYHKEDLYLGHGQVTISPTLLEEEAEEHCEEFQRTESGLREGFPKSQVGSDEG